MEKCPFCRSKDLDIIKRETGFSVYCCNFYCQAVGPIRTTARLALVIWEPRWKMMVLRIRWRLLRM